MVCMRNRGRNVLRTFSPSVPPPPTPPSFYPKLRLQRISETNALHSPSPRAFQLAAFSCFRDRSSARLRPAPIPLPIANFVNSHANEASIGYRESPKRVHSPPPSAFQSVAFSLISKSVYLLPLSSSTRYSITHR